MERESVLDQAPKRTRSKNACHVSRHKLTEGSKTISTSHRGGISTNTNARLMVREKRGKEGKGRRNTKVKDLKVFGETQGGGVRVRVGRKAAARALEGKGIRRGLPEISWVNPR